MSRNTLGSRDNGKVPRDSLVVLEESPRHRVPTHKSSSLDLKLLKISRTWLYSADSMIITNTMRVNRDKGAKELFD